MLASRPAAGNAAGRSGRPCRAAVLLLAALCCTPPGCASRHGTHSGTEPLASDADLLLAFDEIVFGSEYGAPDGAPPIRKWQGPIAIALEGRGADAYASHVGAVARELSALSGVALEQAASPSEANLRVRFLDWEELRAAARRLNPYPQLGDAIAEQAACLFVFDRDDRDVIGRAEILVSLAEPDADIRGCLVQELTQVLGLANDSDQIRPSIFNQWQLVPALTINDRILVRALYDPRLAAGMPRALARPLLPAILADARWRETAGGRP